MNRDHPLSTLRLHTDAALADGAEVTATPLQAHYVGTVMRRVVGNKLVLFNGSQGEWLAAIKRIKRDQAVFGLERQLRPQPPAGDLALIFAPLKRDPTDLVVQKATELGASAIHPVLTARCNTLRVNLERFHAITIEAAEQCERLDLPSLHPPVTLAQFLASWPAHKPIAVAVERSDATPISAPAAGLMIGPEGGFSATELELIRRHPFLKPVSLGPLVLRAETAAIAGLALLQHQGAQAPL